MTLPGFDPSTANVFTKELSFDIHWDENDGVKTNPRIDKPSFFIGGLEFEAQVRADAGNSEFDLPPYDVYLGFSRATEQALAPESSMVVSYSWKSAIHDGAFQFYLCAIWDTEDHLFSFDEKEEHFSMKIEMKFDDVYPHCQPFVNEDAAKEKRSDCKILLVDDEDENKEVFVHKNILALQSPFFDKLFYADFKEKNEDVVTLSEVTKQDFIEYLCCVYPPNRPLAFTRLDTLLRLADRFQNVLLMLSIETFLAENANTPSEKHQTLFWADKYRMPALFRRTLQAMDKKDLKGLDHDKCCDLQRENLKLLLARHSELS